MEADPFKLTISNCEFSFRCPQRWEHLSETEDQSIRFCGECKRKVFFCETDEDFDKYVRQGRCVAVDNTEKENESSMRIGEAGIRFDYRGYDRIPSLRVNKIEEPVGKKKPG